MEGPVDIPDFFTCAVCLDAFVEPLSLPCGHSFCKQCLMQVSQCPMCRQPVPPLGSLRVNIQLRDAVEEFRAQQAVAKQSPEPCEWCETEASTCGCTECQLAYCAACFKQVHRKGTLKLHPLTDYRKFVVRRARGFPVRSLPSDSPAPIPVTGFSAAVGNATATAPPPSPSYSSYATGT